MKGIVFSEFVEMVEAAFSPDIADRILTSCDLASGGVYTAVGTYDHSEILALVTALSKETGVAVPDLVHAFGKHLFGRFHAGHPTFFVGVEDALSFLEKVEGYIHVEVKKLYPDAELPRFTYERPTADQLVMTYSSSRPFGALAAGLIDGCIEHFGEPIERHTEDLSEGAGTSVRFTLTRRAA